MGEEGCLWWVIGFAALALVLFGFVAFLAWAFPEPPPSLEPRAAELRDVLIWTPPDQPDVRCYRLDPGGAYGGQSWACVVVPRG